MYLLPGRYEYNEKLLWFMLAKRPSTISLDWTSHGVTKITLENTKKQRLRELYKHAQ